jgi:transcriptional regulator with XRE-family HTH domain
MPDQPDLSALGERLRKVRQQRSKTLKDVFEETGISIPTLSRIERGDANNIESKTLLTLGQWMNVSLDILSSHALIKESKKSTPDVVELHLRADKNLEPQTATLLAKMFRATYEQVVNKSKR